MRSFLVGVILLAACGGGGDSFPAHCEKDITTWDDATTVTQSCTVDSDCVIVTDYCFGGCATYLNVKNATAAQPAEDDARTSCSASICPPQNCPGAYRAPACINGVCGPK